MTETTIVSADGTELAARHSGSGSPLVLVHGAMGDINTFAPIEEPLAARHSVWVYSRRGRGGSGDGPDYRLQREIEDLLAVLAAAGDGAHVFGHSSGACYALLASPQIDSLRSLVLYEPPLNVDHTDPSVRDRMVAHLEAGEPGRALETFAPVAGIVEAELEAVRAEPAVWEALCEGVKVFPREHRALTEEVRGMLSSITVPEVPMLYLYGELTESDAFPTLEEVAQQWPEARLQALPGQRHLAPMFDPETFVRTVLGFTAAHDD